MVQNYCLCGPPVRNLLDPSPYNSPNVACDT